jgi:pilus assembly protein CpaB
VLLAVVLAIVGYKLSQGLAAKAAASDQQQVSTSQSTVPQTLVVVATKPLAVDKAVDRDSVALVPVQIAPIEYYTNVNDVVGKVPRLDIDAGAPITPRFFKKNNILANQIPVGSVALSLKVDDVVGAGGFIQPGDIVDVLIYIRSISSTPTGEQGKDKTEDIATQARVLLKDTLVLSYEDRLVDSPKGLDDKDKAQQNQQQQRRERTAVIAVPQADVTRVMLGANVGDLRLALHRPEIQLAAAPAVQPDATAATPAPVPADAAASPAAPAPPSPAASSVTAVSALASTPEASSAAAPVLPLSDAEKARIEAAKVPDMVITAAELGRIKISPEVAKKKKAAAVVSRPKIEILRGLSSERTVYP